MQRCKKPFKQIGEISNSSETDKILEKYTKKLIGNVLFIGELFIRNSTNYKII